MDIQEGQERVAEVAGSFSVLELVEVSPDFLEPGIGIGSYFLR